MNKLNKAIQKIANKYNANAGIFFNNIPVVWRNENESEITVSFSCDTFLIFRVRVTKTAKTETESSKIKAELVGGANTIISMDDLPEIQALVELIKEEL